MRLPINSNYVTCCIVANAAAVSMFYMSSQCEYHLVFIMLLMLYMVWIPSCVALVIHFPLWLALSVAEYISFEANLSIFPERT